MLVTDMFKFLFSFWLSASWRQYLREGLPVEQGFFSLPTCTKAPGYFYLIAFYLTFSLICIKIFLVCLLLKLNQTLLINLHVLKRVRSWARTCQPVRTDSKSYQCAQAHDPVDSYKLGWTGVTCKTLWVSVVGCWMQPLLKIEVCRFTINELY